MRELGPSVRPNRPTVKERARRSLKQAELAKRAPGERALNSSSSSSFENSHLVLNEFRGPFISFFFFSAWLFVSVE